MKKTGLMCISMAVLAACSTAKAAPTASSNSTIDALADGVLTVGLDDTFAPMGFRDENNEIVGFDIDLAKAVANKLGVEVEFQPIDWAMKETELNSGNIDCIWNGYSITDERKTQVCFSEPYLDNRQLIIVLSDSDVFSKTDLTDRIVAVQKESSAWDAVTADRTFTTALKDGEPVQFDTNIDCFMDLEAGRSDAIVCDEVLARYVMKQRGEAQYRVLDEDFGNEQYGIGFRLGEPATVQKVDDALNELKDDGSYEKIYGTWFAE